MRKEAEVIYTMKATFPAEAEEAMQHCCWKLPEEVKAKPRQQMTGSAAMIVRSAEGRASETGEREREARQDEMADRTAERTKYHHFSSHIHLIQWHPY